MKTGFYGETKKSETINSISTLTGIQKKKEYKIQQRIRDSIIGFQLEPPVKCVYHVLYRQAITKSHTYILNVIIGG